MDHKQKKTSNASSSATSNTSSSLEIKSSAAAADKMDTSRSRSFLFCLGKQFGRRFFHHHSHQTRLGVCSSTDDLPTSSTDSFSLPMERASRFQQRLATASNIDLGDGELQQSSRSSTSTSGYSPSFCPYDNDDYEDYLSAMQRPHSALDFLPTTVELKAFSTSDDDDDDDDDVEDDDEERELAYDDHDADGENDDDDDDEEAEQQLRAARERSGRLGASTIKSSIKLRKSKMSNSSNSSSATDTTSGKGRKAKSHGLHLSRASITSSVSRIFAHFSISNSHSGRSLSASTTPLKVITAAIVEPPPLKAADSAAKPKDKKAAKTGRKFKIPLLAALPSVLPPPKKEKKQQSILRPPVPYVYTKGMSGLYSRVPRYQSCCPYVMQQCA